MAALNYAQAGVDRAAADRLVERIALISKKTLNRRVKSSIGGYASLFELDKKRWLAASTDGVGTKLKIAFRLGMHETVGIDLVAMSVNDLLCTGAEPLFFLDYFATGKLQLGVAEKVLQGIVEGCRQARCALVGGETAEMPDIYHEGEYDLAGFAVGFVDPKKVLPRKEIKPGDTLIGIASTGCHSNGYSLLRRLMGDDEGVARELLTPTRIYTASLMPLMSEFKGLAHITGSGFLNIPRISEKVSYEIEMPARSERPAIYDWVRRASSLPDEELFQTFNMGLGIVAAVTPAKAETIVKKLKRSGEKAWVIGKVTKRKPGMASEITVTEEGRTFTLKYE